MKCAQDHKNFIVYTKNNVKLLKDFQMEECDDVLEKRCGQVT